MTDRDWPASLVRACAGEGVETVAQPIVDLARGTVVGYEALARFTELPAMGPDLWFNAARGLDLVAELEAATLRAALCLRPTLPSSCFLTVNVGPDVLGHPAVKEAFGDAGDLGGLVVELTEHAPIDSYLSLEPHLDRLRGLGAMIAIDDAGSGYAGLNHLLQLRPDFLKLDRQLVAGIDRDEAKRAMVETLGSLSSRLDTWLLAEGLETWEETEAVTAMGVPLGQGYFLARPAPAWADIDADIALQLIATTGRRPGQTVRALLATAPVVTEAELAAYGGPAAQLPPPGQVTVVLDARGRPTAVVDDRALLTPLHDDLRVNLDTPVEQALQRAMTRLGVPWSSPLVCIDAAGRYVGVAAVQRLVMRLAGGEDPVDPVGTAAG
jgi:EAL domain-containing protein (putative c-di-GMP-specific phosphodiesterase class I)